MQKIRFRPQLCNIKFLRHWSPLISVLFFLPKYNPVTTGPRHVGARGRRFLLSLDTQWRLNATGRLQDSGRQNDEKMSRKTGNAPSRATFFRHCAVHPGACFVKVPKLFGRISGGIVLLVSSKRRRLEARHFADILILIPFTTYEKTSFTE